LTIEEAEAPHAIGFSDALHKSNLKTAELSLTSIRQDC
jgi:hypothetical protein